MNRSLNTTHGDIIHLHTPCQLILKFSCHQGDPILRASMHWNLSFFIFIDITSIDLMLNWWHSSLVAPTVLIDSCWQLVLSAHRQSNVCHYDTFSQGLKSLCKSRCHICEELNLIQFLTGVSFSKYAAAMHCYRIWAPCESIIMTYMSDGQISTNCQQLSISTSWSEPWRMPPV